MKSSTNLAETTYNFPEIEKLWYWETRRRRIKVRGTSSGNHNSIGNRLSKEKLQKLYVDEKKSTTDIAALFKCSKETVRLLIKKYNLPVRTKSEAQTLVSRKRSPRLRKNTTLVSL